MQNKKISMQFTLGIAPLYSPSIKDEIWLVADAAQFGSIMDSVILQWHAGSMWRPTYLDHVPFHMKSLLESLDCM